MDFIQKELEIQKERERIQQAQRSLELERLMNRYKKDSYRQELDQCLQYKHQKDNEMQGQQSEGLKQDIQNIHLYAQKEMQNQANYKSMLQHKEDLIRARQGQYKDIVQAQAQQRDWQLSQLINQRNEQYQREQEARERAERERRIAMTEERQRSLERQMQEKRMVQ